MAKFLAPAVLSMLRAALGPAGERFERKLKDPRRAQDKILATLVSGLSRTAYGQSHGFKDARSIAPANLYREFSDKLPIVDYDGLAPWIEAQLREERSALTPGRVLFYEKTSGSSGPAKYIPFNARLKRSVHRMFLLWLGDLLARGPALETGKTFLGASPPTGRAEKTSLGIPLGLGSERDYLSGWLKSLVDPFFVDLGGISRLSHPQAFRTALCRRLLADGDLEIISIWSPSYLMILLDEIAERKRPLIRLLKQQGLSHKRCSALRRAVPNVSSDQAPDWSQVWPRLKLLSCWNAGHARAGAERLARLFPGVALQGKGLLATEGPLTFPWIRARGHVPLLDEVFFEFEELAALPRIRLLHELEVSKEYSLILSQKGGLTRYRIGDRVRVSHYYHNTPCLEFVGRDEDICDMVGEKLHEAFVARVLAGMPMGESRFSALVPVRGEGHPHYLLLADNSAMPPARLASELDRELQQSHRYREARFLGQLGPVQVRMGPTLERVALDHFMTKGMKWGDIKPKALISDFDVKKLSGAP